MSLNLAIIKITLRNVINVKLKFCTLTLCILSSTKRKTIHVRISCQCYKLDYSFTSEMGFKSMNWSIKYNISLNKIQILQSSTSEKHLSTVLYYLLSCK